MPPSAHAALVVSIIASALGALVMCLLVARYGLTPATREDADTAARRLIITRFGHALAGVCFVATGVLGLVAVVVQTRQAPPVQPAVVAVEPDRAVEARLRALAAEVQAIATRLDQTVTRVAAVDSTTRRLGDEVASISLRARQMERAITAPPPRRAVVPEPRDPVPAAAPPPMLRPLEPAAAPRAPLPAARAPEPAVGPLPLPSAARAVEPAVIPWTPPSAARAPEPASVPRSLPAAARAPEPVVPPPAAAPAARATVQAPRSNADGAAAAAKPDDPLADKLREDWKTIRGGFATAGDDFKAAIQDLGRKLWR